MQLSVNCAWPVAILCPTLWPAGSCRLVVGLIGSALYRICTGSSL